MNTLILTGNTSYDQGYAAAAALRVFPEADLRVVSWTQVCDILEGSAHDYDTVLLLGVSLLYDSTRAAFALNELREVGCKVHYFTDDPEYFLPTPLNVLLKIHCNRMSLSTALLDHYKLAANDLRSGHPECDAHRPAVCEYFEAAWAHEREMQDSTVLRKVLEALSQEGNPANWSLALQEMHHHWMRYSPQPLPGACAAWLQLQQRIDWLLPLWWQDNHASTPILLSGESGTPLRDLAAQLQCPALYNYHCETGADDMFQEMLRRANGAAILLEEIDALPLPLQTALLVFLETARLGCDMLSVRLVATTHRDLERLATEGKFLPELYCHLKVCEIKMPPLRERLEDLPVIADELARRHGLVLPAHFLPALKGYDFPGNERELALLLECASLNTPEEFQAQLTRREASTANGAVPGCKKLPDPLDDAMRTHVANILAECNGNKSIAAQRLKISRNTLRKYL